MAVMEALPYVGMVSVQVLTTGVIVANKEAILTGISNYTFILYTNSVASLILFLVSFVIQRSCPPLKSSVIIQCFGLGFIGHIFHPSIGFEGLKYAPAAFASAIFNILPGLVFVLATVLRMEKVQWGSSSTLVKTLGTVVSVSGAIFATLYQGPQLVIHPTNLSPQLLFVPETNMLLGGSLIALQCLSVAILFVTQALIVKNYSGELVILFFYTFSVAVITLVYSLVMEGEHISWSLEPTTRLLSVLFTGILGLPLQNVITLCCIKRKGPLFTVMFQPLGIVTSAILGFLLLGEPFYLGSLLGSVVIVVGLYSFLWGKAQEEKIIYEDNTSIAEATGEVPLLEDNGV